MKLFDGRSEFYQYDTNQKLICDECTIGEEIHFSNGFYAKAAICNTYDFEGSVVVNVPNSYLLHSGDLIVYRMYTDSEGRSTTEQRVFRVNARKKPSDYVYTETEVLSYKALEAKIPTKLSQLENDIKPTDEETIGLLIETDMLPTVYNTDGKILTNETGKIVLRY